MKAAGWTVQAHALPVSLADRMESLKVQEAQDPAPGHIGEAALRGDEYTRGEDQLGIR